MGADSLILFSLKKTITVFIHFYGEQGLLRGLRFGILKLIK